MSEIYMIYAKKEENDLFFDYKTTKKSWDDVMEMMERLTKHNKAVSMLNIEEGGQVMARTFYFNGSGNEQTVYKVTGGVINI